MKKYLVVLSALILLLLIAAGAQAKPKDVSFRNKKDGSLKLYCTKNTGRLQTTIRCDGKLFTPDADWEEINAEKVCFQHDDGRIRGCDELSKLGSMKKGYVCFDNEKKSFPFTPGSEWKRLADSDKVCSELLHSDVIRYSDMPSLDIDW